jgi:molybdopterin molybdotransferase
MRAVDTRAATPEHPARLRVTGAIAAGDAPGGAVTTGSATRIMTGAPLPAGADAVARFEELAIFDDYVEARRPLRAGENVRPAGEDARAGERVLRAGATLDPAALGLLAALNHATIRALRRPRVAILATGNEVVEPGAGPLAPGQIRNSNSYALAALVTQAGGLPQLLGVARDDRDDLAARLAAADAPDLLITSGGVSHGDYDMVKDVLRAHGQVDIWQVRMQPGRPLAFGLLGATPLLGLPGNPAAAIVSFLQFGWPAIRRMLGHTDCCLPEVEAALDGPLRNTVGRRRFVRGALRHERDEVRVRPVAAHGSGMLTPLLEGDCLIIVPEDVTELATGDLARVQLLPGALP